MNGNVLLNHNRRWSSTSLMELSQLAMDQEPSTKILLPAKHMTKDDFFPVAAGNDEEADKSK